ncbi:competence protein ComEA [Nocardioides thalensis]|uniref:Competence protein ComEA n=1 Tax=Nocardioides thalensis TaxID=1914755 RepID=A0A853C106_9ACTN|nr:ComEA family DNA-binding protein [Nocardioides thalensis]NYJ00861.1 competence protein ComEA [Nocardioides thalensis]
MRSRRTPDAAWSEAAARRLAQLTADLGGSPPSASPSRGPARSASTTATDATDAADEWWADHTRVSVPVTPADRAPQVPAPTPAPAPATAAPVVLPRPGRHASRRPRARLTAAQVPRLGAAHVAVVAVLAALGIALAAWWVVQQRAEPIAAQPVAGTSPLVAGLSPSAPTSDDGGETGGAAAPAGEVTVDVTGKVRRPGIVVLDAGARVVDALEAAGGARAGVDLSGLNLARVLVDGEQVVVGLPVATAPVAPVTPGAPSGAPATLVNLNLATEAELETLPEVGPVTAAAIVAWREQHGGFTAVDELLEVDGIGEATLAQLSPYVTV